MPLVIQLKFYASLARFKPDTADRYEVPDGTTVDRLINRLALPREEVKLIFINGRKSEPDKVLQNNDRVGIFPPVGGG
ncbi:MAG: MoaD/ThiS family protein [Desulfobacterales bacterium]|nr:MoaD/ThiS family protein [Desulfobacterales bacterium]